MQHVDEIDLKAQLARQHAQIYRRFDLPCSRSALWLGMSADGVDRVLRCRKPDLFLDLSFGIIDEVSSFSAGFEPVSSDPLPSDGRRDGGCSVAEERRDSGQVPV